MTGTGKGDRAERDQDLSPYRSIAESTYDWETWLDFEGRPRWVNPAVRRITGYSPEECMAMEQYPLPMVHPDDRERVQELLRGALRGGEGNDVEFRVLTKAGAHRWVAVSFTSFADSEGESLGVRTSVRDIHERKTMEVELDRLRREAEAASSAKSILLANVSHELRTPLHCITGFADLLRATSLTDRQAHYVDVLVEQASHLRAQVEMLLDLAALDAGKSPPSHAPFSPPEALRSTLDALTVLAEEKALDVSLEVDPSVPARVAGDRSRVSQVARILLDNAIKFTDRGEVQVGLSARNSDDRGDTSVLELRVDDSGPGIPPELEGASFQPFRRAADGSLRALPGAGLGLSLAERAARSMGGRVEVRRRPEGGTRAIATFRVQLLAGEDASSPFERSVPAVAAKGYRALVAEDSPTSRELVAAMLRRLGWEATLVSDGESAVQKAGEARFDLILLDHQMPLLDGAQAAVAIRRASHMREGERGAPIVLVTANAMAAEQVEGESALFDAIVAKPLGMGGLSAILSRVEEKAEKRSAEGAEAGAEEGVLDPRVVGELRSTVDRSGATFLERILPGTRVEAEEALREIGRALEDNAFRELERAAHRLRGVAASVGARDVVRLAGALETRAAEVRGGLEEQASAEAEALSRRIEAAWSEAESLLMREGGEASTPED